MKRLLAAMPIVVFAALVVACGGDDTPKPPPEATRWPADAWQLEYTTTGGIAGINQRLTLDSKGTITTEDKRTGRTRTGYVTQPDTGMIRALAAALPSVKSDQGFPVPDAIVTSLKVTSAGQSYGGTFNDASKSPPEVASLLRRLAALYQDYKP